MKHLVVNCIIVAIMFIVAVVTIIVSDEFDDIYRINSVYLRGFFFIVILGVILFIINH